MLDKFINWLKPLPDSKNKISDKKQIAKEYKTWRIRMFGGTFIGYVVYYFTRTNINYATPSMMATYGITAERFGYITMALFIVYGIGRFVSGILADKCNIRTFMALGLMGSSIINLFFGFIPSVPVLIFLWGLNGGFQSMGYPPSSKSLVYWFSPSERATKWGFWSTSHTVGASLIGMLVSFCIKLGNWRAAFYFPGIIGLITSFLLLLILTDKPSSVGLPPIDVYRDDPIPLKKQTGLSHFETLKKYVFFNVYIWILAISYIFIYFIRWFPMNWGTLFMVQRGIPGYIAALLLSFMPLIGSLGGILACWLTDKLFNGRCSPIVIVYLFGLIFSLWGMYHFTSANTSPLIVGLFFALVGFFVAGPQTIIGGLYISRLTVQESVSAACGFVGMFGYIGAILTGFIGAVVDKYGWYGMFVACSICCVLSMILVIMTWNKELQKK
ncbi:MAG: MFS transporter [Endomicrobium sp.]|jgi:sugar phosphate permease|nr:MFS transporter [Endomicrobium sp.]